MCAHIYGVLAEANKIKKCYYGSHIYTQKCNNNEHFCSNRHYIIAAVCSRFHIPRFGILIGKVGKREKSSKFIFIKFSSLSLSRLK